MSYFLKREEVVDDDQADKRAREVDFFLRENIFGTLES